MEQERDSLPVHELPPAVLQREGSPRLRIEGLVARPTVLEEADTAVLPRVERVETFRCEEGWSVPDLRWSGPTLARVLALARPLPTGRYVRVCAGEYAVPLPLAEAEEALLCTHLNGGPLPREHGGPWRLLVPGGSCYTSVKWVDRMVVTAEPGPEDGRRIALARLAARRAGESPR